MPNTLKSSSSEPETPLHSADAPHPSPPSAPQGWLKVGAIAAGSAALGGLAAAWFYRKTLSRLREAGDDLQNPIPNITENETEEDF
jgi:hypothetical protein